MKHVKLENGAPKTRKRRTQMSKTNYPKFENKAPKSWKRSTQNSKPVCPLKTRDSPLSSHQQQESSTITNGMQFKTIQVELRGVANAFPSPQVLAISELRRALGLVSDLNYQYGALRLNRDQVVTLETWLNVHTNICNFVTASPK